MLRRLLVIRLFSQQAKKENYEVGNDGMTYMTYAISGSCHAVSKVRCVHNNLCSYMLLTTRPASHYNSHYCNIDTNVVSVRRNQYYYCDYNYMRSIDIRCAHQPLTLRTNGQSATPLCTRILSLPIYYI